MTQFLRKIFAANSSRCIGIFAFLCTSIRPCVVKSRETRTTDSAMIAAGLTEFFSHRFEHFIRGPYIPRVFYDTLPLTVIHSTFVTFVFPLDEYVVADNRIVRRPQAVAVQIELRFVPGMAGCPVSLGDFPTWGSWVVSPKDARRPATRDFDRKSTIRATCRPTLLKKGDASA